MSDLFHVNLSDYTWEDVDEVLFNNMAEHVKPDQLSPEYQISPGKFSGHFAPLPGL